MVDARGGFDESATCCMVSSGGGWWMVVRVGITSKLLDRIPRVLCTLLCPVGELLSERRRDSNYTIECVRVRNLYVLPPPVHLVHP